MERPLRDLFSFSKKEQLGIMVLVTLICVVVIALNTYQYFAPAPSYADLGLEEKIELLSVKSDQPDQAASIYAERVSSKKKLAAPFPFDPNTVAVDDLITLGFSEKQAESIEKYRAKGGKIYKAEDFKKLYVVNDFMYNRLKNFITLPATEPKVAKVASEKTVAANKEPEIVESQSASIPTISLVDLNSATKERLIALKGIGPIYSSRILKYRDLLGGYSDPKQLGEVYGLKDHPEIVEELLPKLRVDHSKLSRIDINGADWKTLVSHPYIDKNVANSIIAIREQHGPYSAAADVQQSHLVDANLYAKIAPYLSVNGNH
jgi:DNA uptake protein ComE-like DNA-binding protein